MRGALYLQMLANDHQVPLQWMACMIFSVCYHQAKRLGSWEVFWYYIQSEWWEDHSQDGLQAHSCGALQLLVLLGNQQYEDKTRPGDSTHCITIILNDIVRLKITKWITYMKILLVNIKTFATRTRRPSQKMTMPILVEMNRSQTWYEGQSVVQTELMRS